MASTNATSRTQQRFDRALRRHMAGDRVGALAAYREVLEQDPNSYEALNNLAALLTEMGRDEEALSAFRRGAAINASYPNAHHNLGVMLTRVGQHLEAVPSFQEALRLRPDEPVWHNDLGNAYQELLLNEKALAAYDRAVALAPRMHEAWSNRAIVLRGMLLREDAIASLRTALDLAPDYLPGLNNLGIILKECRRFDEAIAAFDQALAIAPESASVLANLSALHQELGQLDVARPLAERAIVADPLLGDARNALGNCNYETGRFAEARACYEQAIRIRPDDPNANYNLALQLLAAGDFEAGWPLFESRLRLQLLGFDLRHIDTPVWDGSPLAGRTVLIHSEQGLGDSIQFVRYAPLLKARGAGRVIMECIPGVASLVATAPGIDETVFRGAPVPRHDVRVYLLSLPHLFQTRLDTIPAEIPYLRADQRPVSTLVRDEPGVLRVGLCWTGNPLHQRDRLRSISLDALMAPLLGVPNVRFYSLQKGGAESALAALDREHPGRVVDLAPHLNDFRDTAAVIARLDLVISVDTSIAHLAGALGRETWLLLPYVSDFRWLRDRTDSPWYPGMRLFRQSERMAWGPVLGDVRDALLARGRPAANDPSRRDDGVPVTTLASTVRRSDGRPRFEMVIPLARLANMDAFAEYQAELVGDRGGHERAVRDVLDELLHDGDALLDVSPGLGLTAISVGCSPAAVARVHAVEHDGTRADELRHQATVNGIGSRLRTFATVADAVAPLLENVHLRTFVRVGDDALAPAVLDAVAPLAAQRRLAAVVWPAMIPDTNHDLLERLGSTGFTHFVATRDDGEVGLDPITDPTAEQSVISMAAWLLEELSAGEAGSGKGEASMDVLEVLPAPDASAPTPASHVPLPASRVAHPAIAIDWPIGTTSGWGVYGLNLVLELARRGAPHPRLLAPPHVTSLSAIARHQLGSILDEGMAIVASMAASPEQIGRVDGPVLFAMGNNCAHTPQLGRVLSTGLAGVIFFEDTLFDAEALSFARTLDVIIAGSTWNAEVLRALGLTNVRVALQGIDPTLFHPAPRSGQLADRFVVFSGGKLEFRKGQDIVVAAFRAFRARHPEALLMTAWHNPWPHLITDLPLAGHVRGQPALAQDGLRIREWLAANGVPTEAVLDLGATPHALMGQMVREADVAVFPNRCEGGTNLVAMECMASGIPTIVSANTGHLDLVRIGGCIPLERQRGVPTPSRFFRGTEGWGESDVDEIVESLERVYADRAAAKRIAADGAARMAEHSWSNQVGVLLEALAPLFDA